MNDTQHNDTAKERYEDRLSGLLEQIYGVDDYETEMLQKTFSHAYKMGFEAGHDSAHRWTRVDRENLSLRWLLMRDNKGVKGIRLGRPEETGWRLIDEQGRSTWQPHHDKFYLFEMLLNVPTDVPIPEYGENE